MDSGERPDTLSAPQGRWKTLTADPSFRYPLVVFLTSRLLITLWAILVTAILPIPEEADPVLRPYLGQPPLRDGLPSLLLGPWQRFDTMRYMRIAAQGYEVAEDSVFPPLYPLAVRALSAPFAGFMPPGAAAMAAAVLISNLAFFGVLVLLYRLAASELGRSAALRTIVYLTIFPSAFFLLAAYSESLFLFLAIASIWSGRRGRFWQAGLFGLLASLTRLTGWVLIVPLAYEYWQQSSFKPRRFSPAVLALLLPLAGTAAFLLWRQVAGLPAIDQVYWENWYQTTGWPGADLLFAAGLMLTGQATFTLFFDFFCTGLLLVTTIAVFRRLGPTYGLYSAMLLLFMLLPTSALKPLYSFSRYALAFFPMFMLFGLAGKNPWVNRLILYPSLALYLYFSGQFFMWGWVA